MEYSAISAGGSGKESHGGLEAGARGDETSTESTGVMNQVRGFAGGVLESVKTRLPDTSNLYLQPLNPSEDITLPDRVSLILQSARLSVRWQLSKMLFKEFTVSNPHPL